MLQVLELLVVEENVVVLELVVERVEKVVVLLELELEEVVDELVVLVNVVVVLE